MSSKKTYERFLTQFTPAKQEYEKVLKESPNHAKVLQQLGWLYQQSGTGFTNQETALRYLSESLDVGITHF